MWDDDDDLFGLDDDIKKPIVGSNNSGAKEAPKPAADPWGEINTGFGSARKQQSFGGSNRGSVASRGSRRSKQEEADEFDDILDEIDGGAKKS